IAYEIAPYPLAPFEYDDIVPTTFGGDRAFHAGGTRADNHNILVHCRRLYIVFGLDLVAKRRVHRAGIGKVAEQPREAIERADAPFDLVQPTLGGLVNELGIGQQRPTYFPEIELSLRETLVCHDRIGQPNAERDRRVRKKLLRARGQVIPMTRRDVAADRGLRRLLPTDRDADHVDTASSRLLHQLETFVLGIAAPLIHQFGTVQADDQRIIGSGLLDGIDQLAHEAAAIFDRTAVFVGAFVGEFGIE